VREVNAQGYSSFPTGDTFVCWGKLKNPMPMRGTNQYYTINKIAPYIKDSTFQIMGWKWVTEWRLSMSGDTAIVFRVLTDNSQIITWFIFSIQNSMLLGPVSGVTDKTIQRPTINVSRSCRSFFANGRLAPCPEKLRNIGMIPNKIILR
jgi:hypothetical protein